MTPMFLIHLNVKNSDVIMLTMGSTSVGNIIQNVIRIIGPKCQCLEQNTARSLGKSHDSQHDK